MNMSNSWSGESPGHEIVANFFFFGIPSFSLEICFSSLKSIDSHAVEVWKESTRRPIGRSESPCYGIDWCSAQKCIKWNQTPWGSGFYTADAPSLAIRYPIIRFCLRKELDRRCYSSSGPQQWPLRNWQRDCETSTKISWSCRTWSRQSWLIEKGRRY